MSDETPLATAVQKPGKGTSRRKGALRQAPEEKQIDFWAPLIQDLAWKDQRDVMERPFLSLSTTHPQTSPIEYSSPDGTVWVKVKADAEHGMATISDWDIVLWAASHIWERIRNNEPPGRTIRFLPYNLLKSVRRETSGQHHYDKLQNALKRLHTTTVYTSIRNGSEMEEGGFHFIDNWKTVKDTETGKILCWEITLNKWVFDGILDDKNILTIDPDYFLLKSGIHRWLYRIARKHAGTQATGFTVSLAELYNKSGSPRAYRSWAADMRRTLGGRELLGYSFAVYEDDDRDMVHMIKIEQLKEMAAETKQELEQRLAPYRQKRSREIQHSERSAFWKAEMVKSERRATKRQQILELHTPPATTPIEDVADTENSA